MNYKRKLPVVVVIMIMLLSSAGMVFGSKEVSEDNATLVNNGGNDAGNQTGLPEVLESTEDTDPLHDEDDHAGFDVTHADELINIQCDEEEDDTEEGHDDDGGPPEGKGPGNKGKKGGDSDSDGRHRYRHGQGHTELM
jgi:hypothetical protein